MKITCAEFGFDFDSIESDLDVILYEKATKSSQGSIGRSLKRHFKSKNLVPEPRAWDLLSIALAVISADSAGYRQTSPDGWTRILELTVSVNDPEFWNANVVSFQEFLAYLTTDKWTLNFVDGGTIPKTPNSPIYPKEDSVALLSGGVDSLVGVIDLVTNGKRPFLVSQKVSPDTGKQSQFAKNIDSNLNTFQVNHNVRIPNKERPQTQRARSIIFMAYGILIATTLESYKNAKAITLYVCENGFISINPSLSTNRVGSLSTRTTHPVVINHLQEILKNAGLNVIIDNPYRHKTKGEMLNECKNSKLMSSLIGEATSCGRILNNKINGSYVHCGRCVPCIVRRSSFFALDNYSDQTKYYYEDLSIKDENHAGFDDVRAMMLAISEKKEQGVKRWLGASLSSASIKDKDKLVDMIDRGLDEIENFLNFHNVK